ncbi:MAG: hypothetical protein HYU58_01520 [Proteobacteria bacterium]|nr:hypothetical protein [Pseudomonadota bacterium]
MLTAGRLAAVLFAAIIAGCAHSPGSADASSNVAVKARSRIQESFEARLAVVQGIADKVGQLRLEQGQRDEIRPILEHALRQNRDIDIGLSLALEPDGFGDKDSNYVGDDPENDRNGRYAAYFFREPQDVGVQSEDMSAAGSGDLWYSPTMATRTAHLLSPGLYPLYGKDTPTLTATAPLIYAGQAFGVVGIDFRYDDLIADLNQPALNDGGQIYLISDNDTWVIAPFGSDIGFAISDRRTGSVDSDLAAAYEAYRKSDKFGDGPWRSKIGTVSNKNLSAYFEPLHFAGQIETWTLVVVTSETAQP